MTTIPAIADAVAEALPEAGEHPVAVYLFGSRARGEERPGSDVDLALLRGGPPLRGFEALPLDLELALERRLGLPVQVVILDTSPPDLVHRVLRDGLLLDEQDPAARVRFEVEARNRYFDLEPFRTAYRSGRRA